MKPKSSNTPTLVPHIQGLQCPPCTWHTVGCDKCEYHPRSWMEPSVPCYSSSIRPLFGFFSLSQLQGGTWVTSWVCQRVSISPSQPPPSSDTFSFPSRTAQFGHLKNRCFLTTTVYHEYFWFLNLGKLLGFCWSSGQQTKQLPSKPHLKWQQQAGIMIRHCISFLLLHTELLQNLEA